MLTERRTIFAGFLTGAHNIKESQIRVARLIDALDANLNAEGKASSEIL